MGRRVRWRGRIVVRFGLSANDAVAYRVRAQNIRGQSNPELQRMVDRIRRQRRIGRAITAIESEFCSEPTALGLRQWTVIVPQRIQQQLPKQQLRALLNHEIAHLVRGDIPWLWIERCLVWCFAFQPLNRVAARRWRSLAEVVCDEWAIQGGVNPQSLAECLTAIAEWQLKRRSLALGLHAVGTKSDLVMRVERLVHHQPGSEWWMRRWPKRIACGACASAGVDHGGRSTADCADAVTPHRSSFKHATARANPAGR